jgi:hypothetical protein
MGLPATFKGGKLRSSGDLAGRDNDRWGRGDDRRTGVGECADAGQAGVGRTGQRGTSQNESEGEDETDGSHLTVSGFAWPTLSAVVVADLITIGRFRRSAPKRKMVSSPRRIVSWPRPDETILYKKLIISMKWIRAVGHWATGWFTGRPWPPSQPGSESAIRCS